MAAKGAHVVEIGSGGEAGRQAEVAVTHKDIGWEKRTFSQKALQDP